MKDEIPAISPRNSVAVVWDVVVAPLSAFAALRERPTWLWAFVITCVLGIIGAVLQIPAASNVVVATLAHSPSFASLTPAQQQQQSALAQTIQRYSWTVYPIAVLAAAAISALVLLIANAIGKESFAAFRAAKNAPAVEWSMRSFFVPSPSRCASLPWALRIMR